MDASSAAEDVASSPDTAAAPNAFRAHPIFNNCVLHAGDVKVQRRRALFADGGVGPEVTTASCDFNAECSRVKGKFDPGDGSVSMECVGGNCTCSYLSNAKGSRPSAIPFQTEKPCDSTARAEQLFTETCLSGMWKPTLPHAPE
jgi:hypothetical protein